MYRLMDFRRRGKRVVPYSDNVTIGHNATIHACEMMCSLIGMGSVILDQSKLKNLLLF